MRTAGPPPSPGRNLSPAGREPSIDAFDAVFSPGAWQSGFMRLGVLGPLQVTVDGELVKIGGVRLRALLIRLALDAGRTVTIAALASALWPDDGPADPENALQTLVSRLRRALPRGDVVQSAP